MVGGVVEVVVEVCCNLKIDDGGKKGHQLKRQLWLLGQRWLIQVVKGVVVVIAVCLT